MEWISIKDKSQIPNNNDILLIQINDGLNKPEFALVLYNKNGPVRYSPMYFGQTINGEVVAWMKIIPYIRIHHRTNSKLKKKNLTKD